MVKAYTVNKDLGLEFSCSLRFAFDRLGDNGCGDEAYEIGKTFYVIGYKCYGGGFLAEVRSDDRDRYPGDGPHVVYAGETIVDIEVALEDFAAGVCEDLSDEVVSYAGGVQ